MTWPSTLPSPTIQAYGAKQKSIAARTEMEAGSVRVRKLSTVTTLNVLTVLWVFTDAQMTTFREWYAQNEAAWVSMNLATGDGGSKMVDVRFSERWIATLLPGSNWDVTATLEVNESWQT